MDEFVYMTDMNTNELIYLNKAGLDHYGFSDIDELRGKNVMRYCRIIVLYVPFVRMKS